MGGSNRRLVLSIFNVVGFVLVLVVNVLANTLPLGGSMTGELSDRYPNLFVPAGVTFSIWGVIYVLLGMLVVYGLVCSAGTSEEAGRFIDRIGARFLVTCAANAGWIFSWHYGQLVASLACMALLLIALIAIYARLGVGRSGSSPKERYLVHLPVSVYLGWITIAAFANLTAVLVAYGWERFAPGGQIWAVAMAAIGIALALVVMFSRNDVFYALVVDWALLGILIKRTADGGNPAPWVTAAAIAGIGLLTLGVVTQIARRRVYR